MKLGKQADKARDATNDFDAGKAAETATATLSGLKNKAAETLHKAGVTAAVSGAAAKAAEAVTAADLGSKAQVAGEKTASTASSVRDWAAEMFSTMLSRMADSASHASDGVGDAGSKASGLVEALQGSLRTGASDAGDKGRDATKGGIKLDPDTLAQLGRILIMVGTALSAVFANKSGSGDAAQSLRQSTRGVGEVAKDQADQLAGAGKTLLGTLADALIQAIEKAEDSGKKAIDQGRDQVVQLTDTVTGSADTVLASGQQAADDAADTEVAVEIEQKEGMHFFRWLLIGILVGAGVAYYSGRNDDETGWEPAPSVGGDAMGASTTSYWPSGSAAPTPEASSSVTPSSSSPDTGNGASGAASTDTTPSI